MELIGTVESLWRYPVKSMRGEELQEAFVGFPGVYGDCRRVGNWKRCWCINRGTEIQSS
jgi:hypothetical protein